MHSGVCSASSLLGKWPWNDSGRRRRRGRGYVISFTKMQTDESLMAIKSCRFTRPNQQAEWVYEWPIRKWHQQIEIPYIHNIYLLELLRVARQRVEWWTKCMRSTFVWICLNLFESSVQIAWQNQTSGYTPQHYYELCRRHFTYGLLVTQHSCSPCVFFFFFIVSSLVHGFVSSSRFDRQGIWRQQQKWDCVEMYLSIWCSNQLDSRVFTHTNFHLGKICRIGHFRSKWFRTWTALHAYINLNL